MQVDNFEEVIPQRLQDIESTGRFPRHIAHILNPGKPIPCTEIICRLVHVCMIEVGFIPMIEDDLESEVKAFCDTNMRESVPKLVESLKTIHDKYGNLHNVRYKAIVYDTSKSDSVAFPIEEMISSPNESSSSLDYTDVGVGPSTSIPVSSKDSGDGSIVLSVNSEHKKHVTEEVANDGSSAPPRPSEKMEKVFSETISVSVIHEGLFIFVVGNGPGFHKNAQLSVSQYMQPRSRSNFPLSATVEDYLKLAAFSAVRFVDDVKRSFCYPLIDEIDGLSFEIRSLSWFPAEVITEIAKRSSPLAVFRLRATCVTVKNALADTNQQLWRIMLKRDFPHYNLENLKSDMSPDKFYKKYTELSDFSLRRPFRRTLGPGRLFPFYLLSNFRV